VYPASGNASDSGPAIFHGKFRQGDTVIDLILKTHPAEAFAARIESLLWNCADMNLSGICATYAEPALLAVSRQQRNKIGPAPGRRRRMMEPAIRGHEVA
jgi:hypothetical protein